MVEQTYGERKPAPRGRQWRRLLLWGAALGLTYVAGKLAVGLAKWSVLMYLAPGAEAKLIMVPFVAGALLPWLLFALPGAWLWWRLFRSSERSEVGLMLALELAFLAYVDVGELQRELASFLH